jgi:hypothetical protein
MITRSDRPRLAVVSFYNSLKLTLLAHELWFDSLRELGIFLFTTGCRTALGPTHLPIQCVLGVLSVGVKWRGRESDRWPPSSAEVKECVELNLHSPNTPSLCGDRLKKKHRDKFNITSIFTLIICSINFGWELPLIAMISLVLSLSPLWIRDPATCRNISLHFTQHF